MNKRNVPFKKRTIWSQLGWGEYLYFVVALICMWIAVTSTIQAFRDPKLTRTELFLMIPHTIMLDFK